MISMNVYLALGLFAAIAGSVAFLVYIHAIVWGRTRPHRSTWLIWSVLSSLSFSSNIMEGATTSIVFLGSQTGFTILIFLLSLPYGSGSLITRRGVVMLSIAGVGLAASIWSHSAIWALAFAIGVSALGGIATTVKSFYAPQSENLTCWWLSFLAALAGLGSVGGLDPVLLAYPVYLAVLYGAILMALLLGRERAKTIAMAPLVLSSDARVTGCVTGRVPYRRGLRRVQPNSPGLYQSP